MQRWLVGVLAAGASASDVANWRSAFETRYDAVILGTGLKESLLAGLLANRGKKVLQLDRNEHYGGAAASLDLSQLYERLGAPGEQPNQKKLGASDSYRVDLAPKVVMAHGAELQLLVHSGAWKHMDWKHLKSATSPSNPVTLAQSESVMQAGKALMSLLGKVKSVLEVPILPCPAARVAKRERTNRREPSIVTFFTKCSICLVEGVFTRL